MAEAKEHLAHPRLGLADNLHRQPLVHQRGRDAPLGLLEGAGGRILGSGMAQGFALRLQEAGQFYRQLEIGESGHDGPRLQARWPVTAANRAVWAVKSRHAT